MERLQGGRRVGTMTLQHIAEQTQEIGANLLLNIGPVGDGSIHPDDAATLREVGSRIG